MVVEQESYEVMQVCDVDEYPSKGMSVGSVLLYGWVEEDSSLTWLEEITKGIYAESA